MWQGMRDARTRQREPCLEALQSCASPPRPLASSLKRTMPAYADMPVETRERREVGGHAVVAVVPSKHGRQPRILLAWRVVASLTHLPSQLRELRRSLPP